jgi:hypothetical protein
MNKILSYHGFINEAKSESPAMQEFAQKRHDGAKKIADGAKEKSGAAMLTYHHFSVKLPYYKKAALGKFDLASAKTELKSCMKDLNSLLKTFEPKDQIPFQKVMGRIEVLGELIIFSTK